MRAVPTENKPLIALIGTDDGKWETVFLCGLCAFVVTKFIDFTKSL